MPDVLSSGEFYSLMCALIWAAAVIMFRKSGERIPPLALNFFKDTIACVLLLCTLPLLGRPLFSEEYGWKKWLTLLVSGALGIGIADTLFFASLNRLGAVGSAIVDSLYSPFVVFSAFVYLGEPLRLPVVVGAGLMVAAIIVGTAEQPSEQAAEAPPPNARRTALGIILGVISMALMALGIVIAKPVLNVVDPWWAATVRVVGGLAFLIVQVILSKQRKAVLACFRPQRVWRYSVPAAVFGAYLSMVIWVMGFKYTSAGVAGVLNQMSSIFVLILAAIFLKERVTLRKALAIGMAFVGAVTVVM